MKQLIQDIKKCRICESSLPLDPKPIFTAHSKSKIVIIGQAPGLAAHNTGIPWDDKSGENLKKWMGIDDATFYDPEKIALIPMGFCYPGRGKSGDIPPRKECAPQWHKLLLNQLNKVELIVLIGKHAQDYYLREQVKKNLTIRVENYKSYLPKYFVLPHPSPRNNIWMAKNEWFIKEVIPALQLKIQDILK